MACISTNLLMQTSCSDKNAELNDTSNKLFKKPFIPFWREKKVIIGERNILDYLDRKYKPLFIKQRYPVRLITPRMVNYIVQDFKKFYSPSKSVNPIKLCNLCCWPMPEKRCKKNEMFCDNCEIKYRISLYGEDEAQRDIQKCSNMDNNT